jgi:hypothetical protein
LERIALGGLQCAGKGGGFVTDLRADALSPIDTATLWPQLSRLNTEVIATRSAESLLISSGLAATGLARIPRVPRTAVLGLRRGLRYRGVVVCRELGGGAAWEICSLRLARDIDDDATACLLASAADDIARRGGRRIFLRYPEGTPHEEPILESGVRPYMLETLYAVTAQRKGRSSEFRTARRLDRHGLFRLYNRSVPTSVRQNEAATLPEWRALVDSLDCEKEFVLEGVTGINAWTGIGEREVRISISPEVHEALPLAFDLVECQSGQNAALVAAEHQPEIAAEAERRGYPQLGSRYAAARRMVLLHPMKEGVPAPAAGTQPLT